MSLFIFFKDPTEHHAVVLIPVGANETVPALLRVGRQLGMELRTGIWLVQRFPNTYWQLLLMETH